METTFTPRETKNLDGYGAPALEWERIVEALGRLRDHAGDHVRIGRCRATRRDALAALVSGE